jgi:hypothetical protein
VGADLTRGKPAGAGRGRKRGAGGAAEPEAQAACRLPDGLAEALAGQWARAAGSAGSAPETLVAFLKIHLEALAADPAVGEILYGGAPDDEAGLFDAALRQALRPVLDGAAGAIERGQAEKQFRRDADPASAAVHYLGIAQMSFNYWQIRGQTGSPWETAESLCRQFLEGLGA